MKYKQIGKVPPKKPEWDGDGGAPGRMVAAQLSGNCLLLDMWSGDAWRRRHATDMETGEYATYEPGEGLWHVTNVRNAFGDIWTWPSMRILPMPEADREAVESAVKACWGDAYDRIWSLESDYSQRRREMKEARRLMRIQNLMETVPAAGNAVYRWAEETIAGSLHYAFYGKGKGLYHCTACQGDFREPEGIRMKHGGEAACPLCGHMLKVEKRLPRRKLDTWLTVIHGLDGESMIERHFSAAVHWGKGRAAYLREDIRLLLPKGDGPARRCADIYYRDGAMWDTKNPKGRKWHAGYLYPEGVREGLEGTCCHGWMDVLPQIGAMGILAYYDRLIMDSREPFVRMAEYLAKGRFRRLLGEASRYVGPGYGYFGESPDPRGHTIGEVLGIRDRQKINRLRQEDGGMDMLSWMQWSDRTGKRIGSDVLAWYEKNRIRPHGYGTSRASGYLSPEQLMHYLSRQMGAFREGGNRRTARQVFETYEDYLAMAAGLGKDLTDAMVYRPRELGRRHAGLVDELEKRREAERIRRDRKLAQEEAERMEGKYPGSREVLAGIKPKYEYEGEKFLIVVPQSFFEIAMEGMALHHCVGHTERYFDRILQHETYICFLRRKEEPEKPFYTIEVEPGGTIRQHRGMYDEEPGIEEVKPFLREWQGEIRRRMREEDHWLAAVSAAKREQNMEELRQKNNTRVLEALMEDLMEVV